MIVVRPHCTVLYLQPQKFITALRSVSKRVGGPAFWGCLRVLGFSDAFISITQPHCIYLHSLHFLRARPCKGLWVTVTLTIRCTVCSFANVCKKYKHICVCMYCHNMMTHTYVSSYCDYYYVVILPLWWWRNIRFDLTRKYFN